jgi:glycine cleavage system H protein
MNTPQQLKYTAEHEWVKVEGNRATIGITDFAQQQMGDVVFVELPKVGGSTTAGQAFAVLESVKAVSDIYAPLTGVVIQVNSDLEDGPEEINISPYEDGWIAIIELSKPEELKSLLDAHAYEELVAKEDE